MNPNEYQRIYDSFAQQTIMQTLGASLGRVELGLAEISLPFSAHLCQQDGFLHAGVVTTIVDSACGYAAYTHMPVGSRVLAVEFKVNFLSPAVGETFLARATVKKAGRTLSVCQGDVFAYQAGQEKLIAAMQATMICVPSAEGSGKL
jgi:uncharacterized protein (TIGR00369 family)